MEGFPDSNADFDTIGAVTPCRRAQRLPDALSFLYLPAEVRNQIYECVLQGWVIATRTSLQRKGSLEADIWPATTDPYQIIESQSLHDIDKPSNVLGLLYTCRQIHAETKLLPYSLNTLLCGDKPFPRAWLDGVHVQLTQIRRLQLCSYSPANIVLSRVWLEMLPWFSNLNKVEVHWQLRMPPWGSEEDHISTATADEVEMRKKILQATSAACEVNFHRAVVWD